MAPKLSGFSSSLCPQSQLPSDTWPAQSWSCQTSEQKLPASPYLHCTLPYSHPHCCHKICLLTPPGMLINALFSYLLTVKSCCDLKKNLPKGALVRISCSGSYTKTFAATNSIKEKNQIRKHTSFAFLVPWLWERTSPVYRGLKMKSLSSFKPTLVSDLKGWSVVLW